MRIALTARRCLARLAADRAGVTSIEYGMIAILIAVVVIGLVTSIGGTLQTVFSNVNASI